MFREHLANLIGKAHDLMVAGSGRQHQGGIRLNKEDQAGRRASSTSV